ncbi:MFS transporter [Halorussus halophilus]|uniref:MFS transporter n=1 Tax=Halorussus halophilus TaxID=2650975 RepID=UPI0013017538|nr:MFS transporter [Halorussus halophilus]
MSKEREWNVGVVLKYYLFRAVANPGFIWPIYALYVLSFEGVGYATIGYIGTVQAAIVVVGEIPTGYVGDRIGRRNSLLVAQVLFTLSTAGMILATDALGFTVAFGVLSVANTFISGSADAWLYDILEERLDEDSYTYVRGRGGAVGSWVMAGTMIAGSLLYVLEPVYPFYAALAMNVVSFFVVAAFPKNAQYATSDEEETGDNEVMGDAEETRDGEKTEGHEQERGGENEADASGTDRLTIIDALPIIRQKLTEPPLRSFVVYMALFFGVLMTAGAYIQPIAVEALKSSAGDLLAAYGVPEAASLGVLYASFTVVSAIASDRASNLEAALGVRGALLVVPLVTAVAFVAPAFVAVAAFPMFFVMRGARSVVRPIAGQYLNDHVESVGRATVLSAVSMVYALARIPFALGSGVAADAFTPILAVAGMGVVLAVGGTALQVWRPPIADVGTTSVSESATAE